MTEQKNKNGVPIRVGQVWADHVANQWENLFDAPTGMLVSRNGHDRLIKREDGTHFFVLISDPIWGDVSAHVIVTDEQKGKYKKPDCAQRFDGSLGWIHPEFQWATECHDVWRVPASFTAWEPFEPEKPQYKLFEIDWSGMFPCALGMEGCVSVALYPKFDSYRVGWKFTDREDCITPDGNNFYKKDAYDQPCDHTGNRKYAIGRLEESQA